MHRINIALGHLTKGPLTVSADVSFNNTSGKLNTPAPRFVPGKGRLMKRVAVVTGGGIGIGRGICLRFAAEGCSVVVADFNASLGKQTVEMITAAGGNAVFQLMDTTKEETIVATMQRAETEFGRLDILVNNAGLFVFGHLLGAGKGSGTGTDRDITPDDWRKIFETNVIGYANCIKHATKYMRKNEISSLQYSINEGEGENTINAGCRGSIINMASISSFVAQPEFIPYSCTKGAVLQLTKCAAMDLAPEKIRVNAVCPGFVETSASYAGIKIMGLTVEEFRKQFSEMVLLKRIAAPQDIANGTLFLASDESSFMTGASIVMDGGLTI